MNYYEMIGVNWLACTDIITLEYKRKAREQHPDKGGDPAEFAELTAAWNTLKDKKKRAEYNMALINHYRNCSSCGGKGKRYKQAGFTAKTMQLCTTCQGVGLIGKDKL